MDNSLKSFLQYVFEIVEGAERRTVVDGHFCPSCSLEYGEFKKTGKLGCATCYVAFRTHISQALKNIHGTNEYKGRIPAGQDDKYEHMILKRELAENRLRLKKAVEAEEFEEAASLRDAINQLMQKIEGGDIDV